MDKFTYRDRLIELFNAVEKDPAITCPHYKTDKTCDTCKYTINNVMCNHTLRTVDYLLANGVIVPPFKVGTKVYVITSQTSDNKNLYIFEDIITHYYLNEGNTVMCFENHLGEPNWKWDKVFLTKEEAEEKLKELNKNG